jgi:hypothetical protein
MGNKKRVILTFEIDDHDGFNDEAFLRHDFLQELSCCVNNPYEDTFTMTVVDADDFNVKMIKMIKILNEVYHGN